VAILYVSKPIEVGLDDVGGSKQQLKRDVLLLFRLHVGGYELSGLKFYAVQELLLQ
jgi:hypothetical protein